MSKYFRVRKVPKAGQIIRHFVPVTGNVTVVGQVAMMPLMNGLVPEQIGRGACGCAGPFLLSRHGRRVVTQCVNGALTNVSLVDEDVVMGNGAG